MQQEMFRNPFTAENIYTFLYLSLSDTLVTSIENKDIAYGFFLFTNKNILFKTAA